MLNNVILLGRLTRDPELRYTTSGMANARFNLAVDRGLSKEKKAEAERNNQPTADFINIVAWGKTAELCANYLSKGRMVGIEGRIQTGSYEKEGIRTYTTDVVVNKIHFISNGDNKNTEEKPEGFYPVDNDEVPF